MDGAFLLVIDYLANEYGDESIFSMKDAHTFKIVDISRAGAALDSVDLSYAEQGDRFRCLRCSGQGQSASGILQKNHAPGGKTAAESSVSEHSGRRFHRRFLPFVFCSYYTRKRPLSQPLSRATTGSEEPLILIPL